MLLIIILADLVACVTFSLPEGCKDSLTRTLEEEGDKGIHVDEDGDLILPKPGDLLETQIYIGELII